MHIISYVSNLICTQFLPVHIISEKNMNMLKISFFVHKISMHEISMHKIFHCAQNLLCTKFPVHEIACTKLEAQNRMHEISMHEIAYYRKLPLLEPLIAVIRELLKREHSG